MDITQADRDAAAAWCAKQPFASKQAEAPLIATGQWDHHTLVQAFAEHRRATIAEVLDAQKEPSKAMIEAGALYLYDASGDTDVGALWQAMLAQFRSENL